MMSTAIRCSVVQASCESSARLSCSCRHASGHNVERDAHWLFRSRRFAVYSQVHWRPERVGAGRLAPVAQWIEHSPSKRRVAGSIPAWGTDTKNLIVSASQRHLWTFTFEVSGERFFDEPDGCSLHSLEPRGDAPAMIGNVVLTQPLTGSGSPIAGARRSHARNNQIPYQHPQQPARWKL